MDSGSDFDLNTSSDGQYEFDLEHRKFVKVIINQPPSDFYWIQTGEFLLEVEDMVIIIHEDITLIYVKKNGPTNLDYSR